MKPAKYISILLSVLGICGFATELTAQETQKLDDGRQWLDSRGLPASTAPALIRAAAANARNQTAVSESLLLEIVESRPAPDSARWAYLLLSRIYLRSGRYHRLIENLDQWGNAFPDDPRQRKEKADFEQFRGLPDQVNGPRRMSKLRHGAAKDFNAPVLINGKRANYLLDTGAWVSVMNEAEAKRLGLTIREGTGGVLGEPSGKGVSIRYGVADEVRVGSTIFHDVSFAILPDVEPWRSMPVGRGGIIGVPMLLHLGCMRWIKGGTWELGCTTTKNVSDSNLVFFENHLLLSADVENRQVFMALDTGAETSDLNTNFAREFAKEIQQRGKKDTTSLIGAGGTTVISSITVPKLGFRIAGTPVTLPQAHVTMQDNPALGGRCCVGNIGLDVLLQTGRLTIDFSRMTLSLR